MSSSGWFTLLVLVIAIERVVELVVSKRHIAWAKGRGGVEVGFAHYPAMVALHVGLLVGCVWEVWAADPPFLAWLGWPMLALVVAAQGLRWWCIGTLGKQWSTRIVVVPGLALKTGGPYRYFKHPNYVAVAVEGLALPLVHTAWVTAVLFTVANGFLMRIRIAAENHALDEVRVQEVDGAGP